MIIVKLIGGLGNQLFQYALGRHLAYILQTELKLDIACFETYKLRTYSLKNFNIQENFATLEEIRRFKPISRKPIDRLIFKIKQGFNRYSVIKEPYFHFYTEVLKAKDNTYLEGYWQSEKYFKDIEQIIHQEFTVKNELQGKNKEIAQHILDTNSISIHIRRGDYVTNPLTNKIHGTCTLEYYHQAVMLIVEKVKSPHFFLFSDDPEWVQRNIVLEYPTTHVDHNKADKDYEDLRLMSLCKHNIIANSVFSWWGAWLNKNPDKIVIAPKRWFNENSYNTKDLLPEPWIKI